MDGDIGADSLRKVARGLLRLEEGLAAVARAMQVDKLSLKVARTTDFSRGHIEIKRSQLGREQVVLSLTIGNRACLLSGAIMDPSAGGHFKGLMKGWRAGGSLIDAAEAAFDYVVAQRRSILTGVMHGLEMSGASGLMTDDDNRVCFASERLGASLSPRFKLMNDKIWCADPDVRAQLAKQLDHKHKTESYCVVDRGHDRRPVLLHIFQPAILQEIYPHWLPGPQKVVALYDVESDLTIDSEAVKTVLGLTASQTRIAILFAKGRGIDEICRVTKTSRHTVRDHLRQVYIRAGVHSQAALMSLLLRLPKMR